jgi:uncharacterized membrane protein (DUF106 family)
LIWTLNRALGGFFNLLLYPFRGFPAIVGLTVISLVVSVAMLIGFKATSDQEALAEVKRHIHAGVFEIRLFKDDFRAILSAQIGILRHTFTYFRLSMVPMLWMLVPIVIVVIQLQFQYGYEGLESGESALVTATFTEKGAGAVGDAGADISLEAPAGVRVETPLLWIPSLREAGWRIVADEPGEYELVLRVGETNLTKSVRVADGVLIRSPVRPSRGLVDQLVWPAEAPVPSTSPVRRIELSYADAEVSLFGWGMHWLIAFFILTMVFAFALQRPMNVKL